MTSAPAATPRVRVAVVVAHRMFADGVRLRLEREADLDVVLAATDWNLLQRLPQPPQLVVLAYVMDDDVPVTDKLRRLERAGIPAIVLSARADATAAATSLAAGARGFVPTTTAADQLVDAIRTVVAGELFVPEPFLGELDGAAQPDPKLGARERTALVLFARGASIREVASSMQTTEETVKSYLKRARRKYRGLGIDLGSRVLLRRHGIREGWVQPED